MEKWTGSRVDGPIAPRATITTRAGGGLVIGNVVGSLLGEVAKGFAWGVGFGGGLVLILRLFGAN